MIIDMKQINIKHNLKCMAELAQEMQLSFTVNFITERVTPFRYIRAHKLGHDNDNLA